MTDDPVRDAERYLMDEWNAQQAAPKCECCGEPIGSRYYEINGEAWCESCVDECVRYTD